jgi:hypothetical protein
LGKPVAIPVTVPGDKGKKKDPRVGAVVVDPDTGHNLGFVEGDDHAVYARHDCVIANVTVVVSDAAFDVLKDPATVEPAEATE